jgi:hypothetical protein
LKALLDRPAEQAEFDGDPAPEDQILREEIPDSADIWEHVQFRHPPQWRLGGGPLAPGRSYLSFEGEVSWEPEHGLQLGSTFARSARTTVMSPSPTPTATPPSWAS